MSPIGMFSQPGISVCIVTDKDFWGLQKFLNQSKYVWVDIKILISITEYRGIFNCLSQYVCILEVYVGTHLSPKYSLNTKWSLSFSHILCNNQFFLFSKNIIKLQWFICIWKKYEVKKNQIHLIFWYFSVVFSHQNVVIWHWDYNNHVWPFLGKTKSVLENEKKKIISQSEEFFSSIWVFFHLSEKIDRLW